MTLAYLLLIISGMILGCFFFGGLLLTVRKGSVSKYPGVWFSVSFIVRVSVTLFVLFWLGQNQLLRFMLCLSGFLIGRVVITHFSKKIKTEHS